MNADFFGYPDVGRYGLAHSLVAWGRCVVWCHETGAKQIAPIWFRPRIGPYFRGERDKREYFRLFRHDGIAGVHRLKLLATAKKLELPANSRPDAIRRGEVVVFRNSYGANLQTHFGALLGYQSLLGKRLHAMTREKYRPSISLDKHIAIHVRLGDFIRDQSVSAIKQGSGNMRLPIDWYVEMLTGLRAKLGVQYPAIVYSDGSDEELRSLLALPDVIRQPRVQSITDMLSIAQAEVLISSASGFSIWAAYLGEVPRICFPGQRVVRTRLVDAIDTEPECEYSHDLSGDFVSLVRHRLEDTPSSFSPA